MKRLPLLLLLLIATAAATATASAFASSGAPPATAHTARATKIDVRHTSIGSVLVTSSGLVLYIFTHDHGHNSCMAISGCAETWPALKTSGKPTAGPGVHASLLSSVKLSGGGSQVTYAGHPLYLYAAITEPGVTSYVGVSAFGGTWNALSASGHQVK
jgi:predicted lipoprotein with Yx(FWY)xxD motif